MQTVPVDVPRGARVVRAIPGVETVWLLRESSVRISDTHVRHMTPVWPRAFPDGSVIGNSSTI